MSKLNKATRVLRRRLVLLRDTDKNHEFYGVRKARFAEALERIKRIITKRGGDPSKVLV